MKTPFLTSLSVILLGVVALVIAEVIPVCAASELVSSLNPSIGAPANGNGDSWAPIISPDGRYVLFASTADNLALDGSGGGFARLNPPSINVYLRDRLTQKTVLVSVNEAGNGGGNGNSVPTGISTNGQFALFESTATDLDPGASKGTNNIFLRDTINNLTWLVSTPAVGTYANGDSHDSTITPDGRFVAFTSVASNLLTNDYSYGFADVFVRDMQAGSTILVSVGTRLSGANASGTPEITPDGRYVAFYSLATNLVPGVTTSGEIYIRDLQANTTTWASTNVRAISGYSGNGFGYNQAISDNGQYVAFEFSHTNLTSSYSVTNGYIFRYNTQTGLTDLVFTNALYPWGTFPDLHSLNMTPDGRFITYIANYGGGKTGINLWDAQTGTNVLVSGNSTNGVTTGANAYWPDIDASGRYVMFACTDTNITTNAVAGIFLRDVQAGLTTLVSVDTNGFSLPVNLIDVPSFSAGGGSVAFGSPWANIDGRNFESDVFVLDVTDTASELVSAHDPNLPSLTPNGLSSLWPGSVSSNAQFIAYSSWGGNLTPNDTNGNVDVFVYNAAADTNTLVSTGLNGYSGNGFSSEPSISSDGRYVAFTSGATNLIAGDTNQVPDVFIRDLQSGALSLISISTGGGFGNHVSYSPVISSDGHYVLFSSESQNLAAGTYTSDNLFLRDTLADKTYGLTTAGYLWYSLTPNGAFVAFIGSISSSSSSNLYVWNSATSTRVYTNTSSGLTYDSISPDAYWLAYVAGTSLYVRDLNAGTNVLIATDSFGPRTGLKFSSDGRFLAYAGSNDVYLADLQLGTHWLASHAINSSNPGNAPSDSPVVSADGRFVAYRSFASNCIAGNFDGTPQIFLFDRATGSNFLASVNVAGTAGNNRSLAPVFSADGQTLVVQSSASGLIAGDYNLGSDIFALSVFSMPGIGTTNTTPIFVSEILLPGNSVSGQAPAISWPYTPGQFYTVQYKNNLADPVWQNLTGSITVNGNVASMSDSVPSTGQRFYRIIQN